MTPPLSNPSTKSPKAIDSVETVKREYKTAIRTRFLELKDRLDTVVYSLIRTKDLDLADEIYLRLTEDGFSFEELAHFSEGPERDWGARVGPCPLNQGHPELAIRLKSWNPGEVKRPFLIHTSAILLRVEHRTAARFSDWEDRIAVKISEDLWEKARREPTGLTAMRRL